MLIFVIGGLDMIRVLYYPFLRLFRRSLWLLFIVLNIIVEYDMFIRRSIISGIFLIMIKVVNADTRIMLLRRLNAAASLPCFIS